MIIEGKDYPHMRRVRMTVVYEFTWAGGQLEAKHVDDMAKNFLADPAGFMNLESPEWDEMVLVDFEDVTDE